MDKCNEENAIHEYGCLSCYKQAIAKELDKMDIELYENSDGCECKTIIKKRLGVEK